MTSLSLSLAQCFEVHLSSSSFPRRRPEAVCSTLILHSGGIAAGIGFLAVNPKSHAVIGHGRARVIHAQPFLVALVPKPPSIVRGLKEILLIDQDVPSVRQKYVVRRRSRILDCDHFFPRFVLPIRKTSAVADTCRCPDIVVDTHGDLLSLKLSASQTPSCCMCCRLLLFPISVVSYYCVSGRHTRSPV